MSILGIRHHAHILFATRKNYSTTIPHRTRVVCFDKANVSLAMATFNANATVLNSFTPIVDCTAHALAENVAGRTKCVAQARFTHKNTLQQRDRTNLLTTVVQGSWSIATGYRFMLETAGERTYIQAVVSTNTAQIPVSSSVKRKKIGNIKCRNSKCTTAVSTVSQSDSTLLAAAKMIAESQ